MRDNLPHPRPLILTLSAEGTVLRVDASPHPDLGPESLVGADIRRILDLPGDEAAQLTAALAAKRPTTLNMDAGAHAPIKGSIAMQLSPLSYDEFRLHIAPSTDPPPLTETQAAQSYQSLFERAPIGLYRTSPDGRILMANPALAHMLGYESPEALCNLNIQEGVFAFGHERSAFEQELQANGRVAGWASAWLRKDGSVAHVQENAVLVRDDDGGTYYEGTVEDVTEQRLSEAEIHATEELYRDLLDISPAGIVTADRRGFVTSVNDTFCELSGFERDQIVGRHYTRLPTLRARDIPRYLRMFTGLITGRPLSPIEFSWRHRDGSMRWAEGRVRVHRREGRIVGLQAVVTDITQYRHSINLLQALNKAAQAMGQAAGRDAIFGAVADAFSELGFCCVVFITDESQKRLYPKHISFPRELVRAAERISGFDANTYYVPVDAVDAYRELVQDKKPIYVPDSTEAMRQQLPQALSGLAGSIIRALQVERSISAPIIADDRVIGVLSVHADTLIKEDVPAIMAFANQMAAAWQRASLMEDLRASVRDLEHTQEQLAQAQKMEALGRLAGGVAHDFNNLLTAITGYSDFLLMQLLEGSTEKNDVQEIRRAADQAAALTHQLLAFSRKQVLQPQIMNVNDIVSRMEAMLRRLIGEHIHLATSLAPDLGNCRADAAQIEQVIMNLVINARDAMPTGGHISIRTRNHDIGHEGDPRFSDAEPGEYLVLSVEDTGSGINPEIMDHIFEPFFTTKESGKGTGLGLATVFGIVRQSDGWVRPSSIVGEGSLFEILLPRVAGQNRAGTRIEEPHISVGSETVLLVEDEASVRELAERTLRRQGYTVLSAARPREAIDIFGRDADRIGLLLTDVVMPEMNGNELAKRLSAIRADLRVLYMSGYTADFLGDEVAMDKRSFLQKPFTPRSLAQRVREALDHPG